MGGSEGALTERNFSQCAVAQALLSVSRILERIMVDNCKLIAVKSHQYSQTDREFTKAELTKLFTKGVIELSSSRGMKGHQTLKMIAIEKRIITLVDKKNYVPIRVYVNFDC